MPEDQVKIKKEKSSHDVSLMSDGDYYPYGTSISIDNELVDELNASGLARGDVVEIRGYAFVDSKSEHDNEDGLTKSIRLQFTSLSIKRENDDRVKQLYGD